MKTFQVFLSDRRRVLVKAERHEERDGKIIFLPEDPSGPQFFDADKVVGIHIWSDDDETP
jgi:hypothetical protein